MTAEPVPAVDAEVEALRLRQWDLQIDRNAYPTSLMAKGRDIYRLIGWEGSDRGGLLLSAAEKSAVETALSRFAASQAEAAALRVGKEKAQDLLDIAVKQTSAANERAEAAETEAAALRERVVALEGALAGEREACADIVRRVRSTWLNGDAATPIGRAFQQACDQALDGITGRARNLGGSHDHP